MVRYGKDLPPDDDDDFLSEDGDDNAKGGGGKAGAKDDDADVDAAVDALLSDDDDDDNDIAVSHDDVSPSPHPLKPPAAAAAVASRSGQATPSALRASATASPGQATPLISAAGKAAVGGKGDVSDPDISLSGSLLGDSTSSPPGAGQQQAMAPKPSPSPAAAPPVAASGAATPRSLAGTPRSARPGAPGNGAATPPPASGASTPVSSISGARTPPEPTARSPHPGGASPFASAAAGTPTGPPSGAVTPRGPGPGAGVGGSGTPGSSVPPASTPRSQQPPPQPPPQRDSNHVSNSLADEDSFTKLVDSDDEAQPPPLQSNPASWPGAGTGLAGGSATPYGGASAAPGSRGTLTPGSGAPQRPPSASPYTPVSSAGGAYSRTASLQPDSPGAPPLLPSASVQLPRYGSVRPASARWTPAVQPPLRPAPSAPMFTVEELERLETVDPRTGLEVPSPLLLFMQYDTDGSGGIQFKEFKQLLMDLDGLGEVNAKAVDAYVAAEFDNADMNHDELISIDEFYLYYYSKLCFKFPVLRTGINPGADLFNIFVKYASLGKNHRSEELGSHQFARLCKDAGLLNGTSVTRAIVDIVYARARAADEQLETFTAKAGVAATAKIYYPQFLFALMRISDKRKSGFQAVVAQVLGAVTTTPSASQNDFLVMVNTGSGEEKHEYLLRPRLMPPAPVVANSNIDRLKDEAAKVATLKKLRASKAASVSPHEALHQFLDKARAREQQQQGGEAAGTEGGPMAAPGGAQPAADAAQQQQRQQHQEPGASGGYSQDGFGDSGEQGAAHGGHGHGHSHSHGGHGHGAAGDDDQPYKSLITDLERKTWGFGDFGCVDLGGSGQAALTDSNVLYKARQLDPDELMMALKRIFERYNMWQGGVNKSAMDKVRFQKMLRDAKLLAENGLLSAKKADNIFMHVLPPANRTLNFIQFIEVLRRVATVLRDSLNEIMERLVVVNGPVLHT